jgi:glutamate racemase
LRATATTLQCSDHPKIGVFDSGVGGLSILRAIRQTLPDADLIYFADSAHAPYGERDDRYILNRSLWIAEELIAQGCSVLVIACNTATAVAAPVLRQTWPHIPIVGIEPGIKPAVLQSKNGRVGVMATNSTLKSQRFARLLQQHGQGAHIVTQPCTGLAMAIESGNLQSHEVQSLVQHHCEPLRQVGVDTVVLGCTHYAFVSASIQTAMGANVTVIDTALAVAKETQTRVFKQAAAGFDKGPAETLKAPTLLLQSSADVSKLEQIAQLWLR